MKHPSCPVCDCSTTRHLGDVDFNRTCEDEKAAPFPSAKRPIEYRQCWRCGVSFAPWMLTWPRDRFAREVYNEDYRKADPEADGTRARLNAAAILATYRLMQPRAHLDYGGGDGALSRILRESGWTSASFDPMVDDRRPEGTYDFITAFEVIEHVPDVDAFMADILALSGPDTVLMCSTLLHDGVANIVDSWYVAPRNGHVMIHSRDSLRWMLGKAGFVIASSNTGNHVAHRATVPDWYRLAAQA